MEIIKIFSFVFFIFVFVLGCRTSMVFEGSPNPPCASINDYARIYINGVYLKSSTTCDYAYQMLLLEKYNKAGFYSTPSTFGLREGGLFDGKQNGLWQSKRGGSIFREEYFKMGLRDSIYRIYNAAGDTIYSTYFNMGTGIEKDYHRNGQLYYEIALKDGYFTDTLRIYDKQGRIEEKLCFEKDSLVFYKSFSYPDE